MLTWVLLVQLHGWFPSMHTHHACVLLEKFLSSDFWVIGKPGLLHHCGDELHIPFDLGLQGEGAPNI